MKNDRTDQLISKVFLQLHLALTLNAIIYLVVLFHWDYLVPTPAKHVHQCKTGVFKLLVLNPFLMLYLGELVEVPVPIFPLRNEENGYFNLFLSEH